MATKKLSEKDLLEARNRAISAGKLPEDVRRELLLMWQRQDHLPKELRKLAKADIYSSNWVIEHVVKVVAQHLSKELRKQDTEAGYSMSAKFEVIAEAVTLDIHKVIGLLMTPSIAGKGSRACNQANATLLRILDLGILGLPIIASIYARTLGVLDSSIVLVADGHLSVQESVIASKKLEEVVYGGLSESDKDKPSEFWLPVELFSPNDFDTPRVESVSPRV